MESITSSAPAQAPPCKTTRRYVATIGLDLVEEGLSLAHMVRTLADWCAGTQEDVALWIVEGAVHRLVAVLRPRTAGVHVRYCWCTVEEDIQVTETRGPGSACAGQEGRADQEERDRFLAGFASDRKEGGAS